MNLANKTVLITGGGSGIGLDIARQFLDQSATVVITGRSLEKLEKARATFPDLHIAQCDVTEDDQIAALAERLDAEFGGRRAGQQRRCVRHGRLPQARPSGDCRHRGRHQPRWPDPNGAPLPAWHACQASGRHCERHVGSGVRSLHRVAGMHSWTLSLRDQLQDTSVSVVELMPPLVDTEMVQDVDLPKISSEKLAEDFMRGFLRGREEITPGQSSQLKLMSRAAPKLILRLVNK